MKSSAPRLKAAAPALTGETKENDVAEMTAPKAAEPIAAPRYKAELFRARSKFDWAGSTRIARGCWRVKRAAIRIAQAIMFTPAAMNQALVNSIPPKAHINSVKQVIIGLRVPNRSDRTPPIKFPATAPSPNRRSKRGTTVAGRLRRSMAAMNV